MAWYDELKDIREYKNLSPWDVAKGAGMSREGYLYIERGEKTPSVLTLRNIALSLGYGSLASLAKRVGL